MWIIDRKTLRLPATGYKHDIVPKNRIYLHHTVGGSAVSTFNYWRDDSQTIATAYLVERDGVIHEVFDPRCWAYHLGLTTSANLLCNQRSIGIELASEGALRSGEELNALLQKAGAPARFDEHFLYAFDITPDLSKNPSVWFTRAKKLYHRTTDAPKFLELPESYRGFRFFDVYEDAQVAACIALVNFLCDEFSIPRELLQGDRSRFEASLAAKPEWSGILSHANVRVDKSDVHPAFPWDLLQASFTGPHELPTIVA